MGVAEQKLWDIDLIHKYDLSGPRYTSYPSALQFNDRLGVSDWAKAVENSNRADSPLSLYFHIPFCENVCYYCACNRIITANKKAAIPYVQNLLLELESQAERIDGSRPVQQIHFGGGTPTFISNDAIGEIMQSIYRTFNVDDASEISIEIHPATVDAARIKYLRDQGFNRLSMGIQDFDPGVQTAVNRFNSVAEVERIMSASRDTGFQSISMDLIYGLPRQSQQSFDYTVKRVIELDPDRISLFNYAHLPHLFKTQRQIDARFLPEPQEKLLILQQSIESLLEAGYVYIGMDHFAKPDDELAIAQANNQLHRNFQGYSTRKDCDLFAFGVSAISSISNTLFQNRKTLPEYQEDLDLGRLPIAKGIQLDNDDLVRRQVINAIICNFELRFSDIESEFGLTFRDYFADELDSLIELHQDGLITLSDDGLKVNDVGRMLVRRICMAFDRYLKTEQPQQQKRYSRII